jgi:hypothetical protein
MGCGAKNLALLQNKCKPLQSGKLIALITGEIDTEVKILVSNCGNIIFAPQPTDLINVDLISVLTHQHLNLTCLLPRAISLKPLMVRKRTNHCHTPI